MSSFSKHQQRRPPEKVEMVPASAFADEWDMKRKGLVGDVTPVGVRLVSDGDMGRARAEAGKIADLYRPREADEEGWVLAFNDAYMRLGVAFGTCRADDSSQPFFQLAEETVRVALTPDGARMLWDCVLAHAVAKSPLEPAADADDVSKLAALVAAGAIQEAGERGLGPRRLVRRALEHLAKLAPAAAARVLGDESPGIDRAHEAVPTVTIRARKRA